MQLTAEQETEALEILHNAGIEGSDATAALTTVCKLSEAPSVGEWLRENEHLSIPQLQAAYGHDACRAALALIRRWPG